MCVGTAGAASAGRASDAVGPACSLLGGGVGGVLVVVVVHVVVLGERHRGPVDVGVGRLLVAEVLRLLLDSALPVVTHVLLLCHGAASGKLLFAVFRLELDPCRFRNLLVAQHPRRGPVRGELLGKVRVGAVLLDDLRLAGVREVDLLLLRFRLGRLHHRKPRLQAAAHNLGHLRAPRVAGLAQRLQVRGSVFAAVRERKGLVLRRLDDKRLGDDEAHVLARHRRRVARFDKVDGQSASLLRRRVGHAAGHGDHRPLQRGVADDGRIHGAVGRNRHAGDRRGQLGRLEAHGHLFRRDVKGEPCLDAVCVQNGGERLRFGGNVPLHKLELVQEARVARGARGEALLCGAGVGCQHHISAPALLRVEHVQHGLVCPLRIVKKSRDANFRGARDLEQQLGLLLGGRDARGSDAVLFLFLGL
mmetsp:Transcript_27542/g.92514  ORF Transcript_27542/g.92514 Transcript_27542/m.92514 type:complete len:418 (+) Transcript_27542:161-1414(+)